MEWTRKATARQYRSGGISLNNMGRQIKNITNKATIDSFIETWKYNSEEIQRVGGVDIDRRFIVPFLEDFLIAFLQNSTMEIYGVDMAQGFSLKLSRWEDVESVCRDIWANPEKYWEFGKDEDAYYHFIKFLWIRRTNHTGSLATPLRMADYGREKV